jgi:hypothetical protein
MPAIELPYINGVRHDFTVLACLIGVKRYYEIQDLAYSDTLAPGKVRGTGPAIRGRTRGIYDAEGSMTLYKSEFDIMAIDLQALDPTSGIGEIPFIVTAAYGKNPLTLTEDSLFGCRIKKIDNSHKEGSDALVVKLDLDILRIDHNGLQLVNDFPF